MPCSALWTCTMSPAAGGWPAGGILGSSSVKTIFRRAFCSWVSFYPFLLFFVGMTRLSRLFPLMISILLLIILVPCPFINLTTKYFSFLCFFSFFLFFDSFFTSIFLLLQFPPSSPPPPFSSPPPPALPTPPDLFLLHNPPIPRATNPPIPRSPSLSLSIPMYP